MKTLTQAQLQEIMAKDYAPVMEFMQAMHELSPFPYKTKFSLEPFMRVYAEKVGTNCDKVKNEVVPLIAQVEEQLVSKIPADWLQSGFGLYNNDDNRSFEEHLQRMHSLIAMIMPSLLFENKPAFIGAPFVKAPAYSTPAMNEIALSGKYGIKTTSDRIKIRKGDNILMAGALILNKFYDQEVSICDNQLSTFINFETGLERHYKMDINQEFIDVEAVKPLKRINPRQIQKLLKNMDDLDLWLRFLPPDAFEFKGFAMGTFHDITSIEVVSSLKDKLVVKEDYNEATTVTEFIPYVQGHIRNFVGSADVNFGFVGLQYQEYFGDISFSLTGTSNLDILRADIGGIGSGIYQDVMDTKKPVMVENLNKNNPPGGEKLLLEKGFQSIILAPMMDSKGNVSTIVEIGSTRADHFNAVYMEKLEPIFELIQVGTNNYLADMATRTNLFIQKQFTSIHPSVEWKFEEVATQYQVQSGLPDFDGYIEPILFKDVIPLYGQSDIVGSSKKRNHAIQEDLKTNLAMVLELMQTWHNELPLHTLNASIGKVKKLQTRLEERFISSDESEVMDLLLHDIHPFLHTLHKRFDELPTEPYNKYFDELDDNIGILYCKRKQYEHSVSKINQAISDYIEADDEKMQKILPHYFEKYKTDGVEYNLYLGQSILENGEFNDYYLKEFRLWQLIQMAEITRLSEKVGAELPVPMQTAQLVFVYSSPLSIRFRMDEKQFDVDGTYNVRYEILKKRIDKAYIKGTKDRLTIPGTISIVYLQETDHQEYLEFADFLVQQGYVHPEFEELELERLQGADGLHALRLRVKS